ncbi:hypothetical protein BGZ99_003257 [Dissophora globulifera]|uniref:Uncharacterized protein n=1 Tax=Dissophora globulifera TaxID=979702 RepID=A0A9P6UWM8_9FUNG|nr:hypothetical protein BGZ99_003257 [Dissophora globulifera]
MINIPHVDYSAVAIGAGFCQAISVMIYGLLFGQEWLDALKKDKGGQWVNRDPQSGTSGLLLLHLCKAWTTGFLLNLTQATTMSQALQLGGVLYLGMVVPSVTSELIFEKRPIEVLRFKYLTGFVSTVLLSCLLFGLGTA